MQFDTFVRKPFLVEAVEITEENIEELAKFIGTLKRKGNGTPFIQVDSTKVPNIPRVYPGYWLTRMGKKTRCYSQRVFKQEFTESSPALEAQVNEINGRP